MRLLLHCCCAPCSAPILEWLESNNITPTLLFYNPNIYPEKEYMIRKQEIVRYAEKLGLEIIDADYNHAEWLNDVKGHETDKERGPRCRICFYQRLQRTAKEAAEKGFDTIATTLASSRWKKIDEINAAGEDSVKPYPSVSFWAKNWRKDGLQLRRSQLLKENGFYNQTYCGCEFSIRKCD